MVNPSSAHLISALLFPAAKVLSLGSGFGSVRVLGKQRVVEWKPCLEGLRQDCRGFVDKASGLLSLGSVPRSMV